MKLTTGPRMALLAAAGVVALAVVLYAKFEMLAFFVDHRAVASLLGFALVLGVLVGAGRLVRASGAQVAVAGALLLFVLFVDVVVSPLPFELAHAAEGLPRPAGESAPPLVDVASSFEMAHPVAVATFRYPPSTPLSGLTNGTIAAYEARGWSLLGASRPTGEGPQDYAILTFAKGAFRSGCTLGTRVDLPASPGPERTLSCTLTV